MVTGRGNYRRIGDLAQLPLESQPDMLGEPEAAARAAFMFWKATGINRAADADDVVAATRLVNGKAMLHLAERKEALR
jgi:putative chitinase